MSSVVTVAGQTVQADAVPRTARGGRLGRAVLAGAWLVLAVALLCALRPGLVAGQDPNAVDPISSFAGPGRAHLLGTDELGRDVFSRVVHGAAPSLAIGFGATAFALVLGTALGVLAAVAGRAVGAVVMRLTDVLLAIPGLLLALLVVAVLGPGTLNATVAIGFAMMPGFVRIARVQALTVLDSGYVRAAVTFGRRSPGIYLRHLLPNAVPPLLVLATATVGTAIISGSSLSFLGLGPGQPSPEWGAMLADSRDFLDISVGGALWPCAAIIVTVLALQVAGRDLRARFEGKRHG
ncbi:ABC transporter permease [Streptomyces sp. NPDC020983]|uniref:ABC transporter permease n=1 Tax=Streptomyces sp. NPDC020983 TaxID=3365106 RepID=UPI00379F89BE